MKHYTFQCVFFLNIITASFSVFIVKVENVHTPIQIFKLHAAPWFFVTSFLALIKEYYLVFCNGFLMNEPRNYLEIAPIE